MASAHQTRISFPSGENVLEGVVSAPEGIAGRLPGVLLCAPEPHLGGTMESPVVQSLVQGLDARGYVTLRFNYRGVGESQGGYSLGVGEVEDARAALKVLRGWPGVDRRRVGLVGYSFGAGIAVRVALRERAVRATVAVSPPLTLPPVGIQTVQGLSALRRPLLVLIGERDGLTPPRQLAEWVERLRVPTIRFEEMSGADRSWQGNRLALAGRVAEFLAEALAP